MMSPCVTNKADERYKNLQTRLDSSEKKYEQLLKKTQLNSMATNVDSDDVMSKNTLIAQVCRSSLSLVYYAKTSNL